MIRIRALHKAFAEASVLAGVDGEVRRGEIVAVVGASGAGKSTLLRCLNGLETFDRGSIDVASFTVTPDTTKDPLALARLRAKVGMVFQEFHLFPHLTAAENVALAPRVVAKKARALAREAATELLAEVGLAERRDAYPAELSGGQKQRVAIARALAMPLDVLLLDEPTSALDPSMREEVREVLREVAEKSHLTMVLVTHDDRLARTLATRVWELAGGVVREADRSSLDRVSD